MGLLANWPIAFARRLKGRTKDRMLDREARPADGPATLAAPSYRPQRRFVKLCAAVTAILWGPDLALKPWLIQQKRPMTFFIGIQGQEPAESSPLVGRRRCFQWSICAQSRACRRLYITSNGYRLSHSVEIPRPRQDAHVARVPVRRMARRLRVSDDVGAGQLDVGFMVL